MIAVVGNVWEYVSFHFMTNQKIRIPSFESVCSPAADRSASGVMLWGLLFEIHVCRGQCLQLNGLKTIECFEILASLLFLRV